jgi:hypothetical protein
MIILSVISASRLGRVPDILRPLPQRQARQDRSGGNPRPPVIAAIATLITLNAQPTELASVGCALVRVHAVADRYNAVWDIVSDLSRSATCAIFIKGFWFSADLAHAGHISAD